MYIHGKYLWPGDDISVVKKIREQVFVHEGLLEQEYCDDEYDKTSVFCIVYDEKDCEVASGRIARINEEYRLGKIAVLKEARGKKLGDFLVRMLVDKAFIAGAKEVIVHSSSDAIGFYETIGFLKEGDYFVDYDNRTVMKMKLIRSGLCKKCST